MIFLTPIFIIFLTMGVLIYPVKNKSREKNYRPAEFMNITHFCERNERKIKPSGVHLERPMCSSGLR